MERYQALKRRTGRERMMEIETGRVLRKVEERSEKEDKNGDEKDV